MELTFTNKTKGASFSSTRDDEGIRVHGEYLVSEEKDFTSLFINVEDNDGYKGGANLSDGNLIYNMSNIHSVEEASKVMELTDECYATLRAQVISATSE